MRVWVHMEAAEKKGEIFSPVRGEKEGRSFGVEEGYRGEEARKKETREERERERRRVGEFIVAAMMVAVSELAISEQLAASYYSCRTYLFLT